MESKLAIYNNYYADSFKLQINKSKVDGQTLLEGSLRIYWGIQRPIRFQQKDESPAAGKLRHSSYCFAVSNDVGNGDLVSPNEDITNIFLQASLMDYIADSASANVHENGNDGAKTNAVVMRRKVKKRRNSKRLSIINGHLYDAETSIFVPAYGSVTNVTVTNHHTCPDVIKALLEKFKVENCAEEYSLCVIKYDGETRTLSDTDIPLLERLELGPREDDAKLFIVERNHAFDMTHEVAQYYNLPEAVLRGFLEKLCREEEQEIEWIKERHKYRRMALEQKLNELSQDATSSYV